MSVRASGLLSIAVCNLVSAYTRSAWASASRLSRSLWRSAGAPSRPRPRICSGNHRLPTAIGYRRGPSIGSTADRCAGGWIRRPLCSNEKTTRSIRKGHAHYVVLDGKVLLLGGIFYPDDRKPLARWLTCQQRYVRKEAEYLLDAPGARCVGPTRSAIVLSRLRNRRRWHQIPDLRAEEAAVASIDGFGDFASAA
jgi:hypothetical protein